MPRGYGWVVFVVLAIAASMASGCKQQTEGDTSKPAEQGTIEEAARLQPASWGTIKLLHAYQGVFLASQPAPSDFEQAAKNGIRTVVNLRHDHEISEFDEKQIVSDLGLDYVHLPWNGPEELTDEVFDEARRILNTTARPALMHCGSANRVGALWLPWRVLDGGLSVEEALAEARTVGLRTPAYEAKARDYIERRRTDDG